MGESHKKIHLTESEVNKRYLYSVVVCIKWNDLVAINEWLKEQKADYAVSAMFMSTTIYADHLGWYRHINYEHFSLVALDSGLFDFRFAVKDVAILFKLSF
jgi:hypothetical protein